jgi:hypothetical protein
MYICSYNGTGVRINLFLKPLRLSLLYFVLPLMRDDESCAAVGVIVQMHRDHHLIRISCLICMYHVSCIWYVMWHILRPNYGLRLSITNSYKFAIWPYSNGLGSCPSVFCILGILRVGCQTFFVLNSNDKKKPQLTSKFNSHSKYKWALQIPSPSSFLILAY